MRLKAAADFAGQQAALAFRKADSATLAAFESQRKKMNLRFDELICLLDQITALLPEKLDALILFLEPDTTIPESSSITAKQPKKTLLRSRSCETKENQQSMS